MNQDFKLDYYRMTGKKWGLSGYLAYSLQYDIRYLHYLRIRKPGKIVALGSMRWGAKNGLEILGLL